MLVILAVAFSHPSPPPPHHHHHHHRFCCFCFGGLFWFLQATFRGGFLVCWGLLFSVLLFFAERYLTIAFFLFGVLLVVWCWKVLKS